MRAPHHANNGDTISYRFQYFIQIVDEFERFYFARRSSLHLATSVYGHEICVFVQENSDFVVFTMSPGIMHRCRRRRPRIIDLVVEITTFAISHASTIHCGHHAARTEFCCSRLGTGWNPSAISHHSHRQASISNQRSAIGKSAIINQPAASS